jgi:hypothetical protein
MKLSSEDLMTETIAQTDGHEPPPIPPKPHTDAAAVKRNAEALLHAHQRAMEIRAHPEDHKPRLVSSDHVRGSSWLDKIADAVNVFCGAILNNFASKDMPGRQSDIQDTVHKILAAVGAALPPPTDPEFRWRRTDCGPHGRTA